MALLASLLGRSNLPHPSEGALFTNYLRLLMLRLLLNLKVEILHMQCITLPWSLSLTLNMSW